MSKYHDINLAQSNASFVHDRLKLEAAMARATALGFDVSTYPARIEAALATMHPLVDDLSHISTVSGIGAPVTSEEFDIILAASGAFYQMQHTLDLAFGIYDQYVEHLERHNSLIAAGKHLPRHFRAADSGACNTVIDMHIRRAANPTESASRSTEAFASVLEALKALELQKAQSLLTTARSFATGDYFLEVLLRRGALLNGQADASQDALAAVA